MSIDASNAGYVSYLFIFFQDGLKSLNDGGETIQNTINAVGGMFNCKTASKVVTVTDEADLAKQLAQAELENADLFGDDDDDEQVGMGSRSDITM